MINWIKPSEELPKNGQCVLVAVRYAMVPTSAIYIDGTFCVLDGSMHFTEDQVLAWCYAPALPDWVEDV